MTGPPAVADGDESLRRDIARTLGDLKRRDRAAERFLLADPDEETVHVVEFGRADRPALVETVDASDVDPSEEARRSDRSGFGGGRERSGGDNGGS